MLLLLKSHLESNSGNVDFGVTRTDLEGRVSIWVILPRYLILIGSIFKNSPQHVFIRL